MGEIGSHTKETYSREENFRAARTFDEPLRSTLRAYRKTHIDLMVMAISLFMCRPEKWVAVPSCALYE